MEAATCEVRIHWIAAGSVMRGDVQSGCRGVETDLSIKSPAPAGDVAEMVALAKRGCFAEQIIRQPVEVGGRVWVNGEEIAPAD